MKTDRRTFVRNCMYSGVALALTPAALAAQQERPPAYSKELVKEFVVAGHNNLDRVKELLAEHPNLINSAWDWGGGDFEVAIGGAGHVGNKDIAQHLIGAGARVNLFVLTMLGNTSLVKPMLEAYPNLVFAPGPHGFTMLHHAQKGGDDALELAEYLQSKGLKETKVNL